MAGGPQIASIALPRFKSSFAHFQRMIFACAMDENVDSESAATIASTVSSIPSG